MSAASGVISTSTGSVALATGRDLTFTAEAGIVAVGGAGSENAPIGGAPEIPAGRPIARMSYAAYFAHGSTSPNRPILFLWDGGPGSSTRGLLMTSFGPVRVAIPQPGEASPPPPSFGNNPDCLLDVADLVFIDAPGTGFGRIEGHDAAQAFYGIDGDAAAFTHFIEQFVTSHAREASPLYLFGHSYGTVRAPVIARLLADDDMPPRGIVSVSQFLNQDDNVDSAPSDPGTDNAYIAALPTYAAIAWYHHRLRDRSPSLGTFLTRVEEFALHDYALALLAGADLPKTQQRAIASTLEGDTGISAAVWLKAGLRIDGDDFRRLVLDDPTRTVGRLDARYVGMVTDPLASRADSDPFGTTVGSTIAAAASRYERDVLGFGRTTPFSPDADIPDLRWNEYHAVDGVPWHSFDNVIPDLARVMIAAPGMRFLLINGYYDLSTTYLGAIEELRHLPIPSARRSNISTVFYETGHEPYAQDDVRHAMHDRIARFIGP